MCWVDHKAMKPHGYNCTMICSFFLNCFQMSSGSACSWGRFWTWTSACGASCRDRGHWDISERVLEWLGQVERMTYYNSHGSWERAISWVVSHIWYQTLWGYKIWKWRSCCLKPPQMIYIYIYTDGYYCNKSSKLKQWCWCCKKRKRV